MTNIPHAQTSKRFRFDTQAACNAGLLNALGLASKEALGEKVRAAEAGDKYMLK